MSESLYCPGQIVPSKEYLENYDKIEWDFDTPNKKFTVIYIIRPKGMTWDHPTFREKEIK